MLTITAILDLYAWVYSDLPTPAGTWDHDLPVDGAYANIKRVDETDYVMLRGSTTLLDWIEDFEDCALPYNDPVLGDVHPGARQGVLEIKDQIDDLVGPHVVFVGHSLGAMHAALLAGYRAAVGKPVDALVMFGEPRSGGPQLSGILANTMVQSYRNADKDGHDIITDVARAIPPLLPYQHVRDPLTDCHNSPRWDDPWLAFRYHHCGHYARAFGCGGTAALSLPV
jgi:pimeloyl-ACP methyl ester carboxylesterase